MTEAGQEGGLRAVVKACGYAALVLAMAATPPLVVPQLVALFAVVLALAAGYAAGVYVQGGRAAPPGSDDARRRPHRS